MLLPSALKCPYQIIDSTVFSVSTSATNGHYEALRCISLLERLICGVQHGAVLVQSVQRGNLLEDSVLVLGYVVISCACISFVSRDESLVVGG